MAIQGEKGRSEGAAQQVAGLAQAHLVGNDHQEGTGPGTLGQPPEPLGEAGALGGGPLPCYRQHTITGPGDGGVVGQGPVPAEGQGVKYLVDGAGQAVDDGGGVHAFQQDPTPVG